MNVFLIKIIIYEYCTITNYLFYYYLFYYITVLLLINRSFNLNGVSVISSWGSYHRLGKEGPARNSTVVLWNIKVSFLTFGYRGQFTDTTSLDFLWCTSIYSILRKYNCNHFYLSSFGKTILHDRRNYRLI